MARRFSTCVLTANDLLEGDVVYLAPDGRWTRRLEAARLFDDEGVAQQHLSEAESNEGEIIGPYLAGATGGGSDGLRPAHFREAFRATGPSNYRHGKQAGN